MGARCYWQLLPDPGWGPGFAEQDGPPVSLRVNDALRWGGRGGALQSLQRMLFFSLRYMPGTLFKTLNGISRLVVDLLSNLLRSDRQHQETFFQKLILVNNMPLGSRHGLKMGPWDNISIFANVHIQPCSSSSERTPLLPVVHSVHSALLLA